MHNELYTINSENNALKIFTKPYRLFQMKCMFFRKKETEVMEMKQDKSSAPKKQSLTLDRSERSRRVLKMESMRGAPLERETRPPDKPTTPPAAKRFLPSESPTSMNFLFVSELLLQIFN